MTLSILVPIYNVADKIERCVVSLMEQTYPDIEYIFVNDCTPDNSVDLLQRVIERYPHRQEQVRILHHDVNKGLAGARNTGYDTASGEVIMIVDSDDYVPRDACENLMRKMQETGADIVSGAYVDLLPGGEKQVVPPADYAQPRSLRRHLCLSFGHCMLWSRVYKATLFASPEMRAQEGVNLSEDYMMTSRLLLGARTAYVNDVVYFYDETDVCDYGKIYDRHIDQTTRSVSRVDEYYRAHQAGKPYLPYIQLAYLHVIRSACQAGLPSDEAQGNLCWWARPIAAMMCHRCTFALGSVLYKVFRAFLVR